MQTSQDALITKYQAEQLKYFTDPYIAPFVKQKRKMMPIINRGSWARVYSFRQVIIKFIRMFDKVNIVSLGAGYDSTYFWLKSQNLTTVIDYIEVDFPDLVQKKTQAILQSQILKPMVDESFSGENTMTSGFKLIGADVRDSETMKQKLESVDKSLPTLVLTECLLVYMKAQDSAQVLSWISETFPDVALLNYEMINPFDKFGKMMVENLESRGCQLLGYDDCPTVEAQVARMKNYFGQNSNVECLPMNIVYRDRLNGDAERSRIEKLEIFDEFEEWDLLQSHYCLCLSARGCSYAKILELKI